MDYAFNHDDADFENTAEFQDEFMDFIENCNCGYCLSDRGEYDYDVYDYEDEQTEDVVARAFKAGYDEGYEIGFDIGRDLGHEELQYDLEPSWEHSDTLLVVGELDNPASSTLDVQVQADDPELAAYVQSLFWKAYEWLSPEQSEAINWLVSGIR